MRTQAKSGALEVGLRRGWRLVIAIYVAATMVFAALGLELIAVAFSGENRRGVIGALVMIALALGMLACAASAARFTARCLGLGVVVDSSGVTASNPPDRMFVGWDQIQRFDVNDLPILSGGLVHRLGSWVTPGDQPVPCVVVMTSDGWLAPR